MAKNTYNGIINIFKEKGYTSHDVVAKMRGILKQKKIGHSGTLDPDATGVLPVLLGNATVLSDMLTDKSKEYEAVLLLGMSTDTQDISGEILKKADTSSLFGRWTRVLPKHKTALRFFCVRTERISSL